MIDDPVYPSHLLPAPLLNERPMTNVDGVRRTPLQSGRTFSRLIFPDTPSNVSVSFLFTNKPQAALWQAWFTGVTNSGEKWFMLPLRMPAGDGPWRCRFTSMYAGPNRVGPGGWRIDAAVEIEERPEIPGDWALYYPEAIIYMSLIDLAVNREWPESQYQTYMDVFDSAANSEWPMQ